MQSHLWNIKLYFRTVPSSWVFDPMHVTNVFGNLVCELLWSVWNLWCLCRNFMTSRTVNLEDNFHLLFITSKGNVFGFLFVHNISEGNRNHGSGELALLLILTTTQSIKDLSYMRYVDIWIQSKTSFVATFLQWPIWLLSHVHSCYYCCCVYWPKYGINFDV